MKHLDALQTEFDRYDVIFCDVWGVIHNGIVAFPAAVRALTLAIKAGKTVILLTNSPRRNESVVEQLHQLNIESSAYSRVVTSGDATRGLIANAPRKIFHIGPDRDLSLYDDLDVELTEEFEAQAVVVTGLFDDAVETPEDYNDMLKRIRARNLPMICANPDITVHRGSQLIWCAGALARDYAVLGGRTLIAGKPHRPIYELALHQAEELLGKTLDKSRILAIGDGVLTDVKGAEQFDLDVLYISGGIHRDDYMGEGGFDRLALDAFLKKHGFHPAFFMEALQ